MNCAHALGPLVMAFAIAFASSCDASPASGTVEDVPPCSDVCTHVQTVCGAAAPASCASDCAALYTPERRNCLSIAGTCGAVQDCAAPVLDAGIGADGSTGAKSYGAVCAVDCTNDDGICAGQGDPSVVKICLDVSGTSARRCFVEVGAVGTCPGDTQVTVTIGSINESRTVCVASSCASPTPAQ